MLWSNEWKKTKYNHSPALANPNKIFCLAKLCNRFKEVSQLDKINTVIVLIVTAIINLLFCITGKTYKELYGKVSGSIDQHLNNDVARTLMEDYPINSKSDLILEGAQDGIVGLLRKWPEMKSKLHVCFNQVLPDKLRQVAWKLFLENVRGTQLQFASTLRTS